VTFAGATLDQIAANLEEVIGEVYGLIVSAYWPFRGEPDLRGFMDRVWSRAGRCALPVVLERGKPLIFRPGIQESRSSKAFKISQCLQAPSKSCPIL